MSVCRGKEAKRGTAAVCRYQTVRAQSRQLLFVGWYKGFVGGAYCLCVMCCVVFFFLWSLSTTRRESFGIQEIQISLKDQVKRPSKCSGELVKAWLLNAAWSVNGVMGRWLLQQQQPRHFFYLFVCLILKKNCLLLRKLGWCPDLSYCNLLGDFSLCGVKWGDVTVQ